MQHDLRKMIYKVELNMADGKSSVITIATSDKTRLPDLIEKNKKWYEEISPMAIESPSKIVGWKFVDELLTFGMPQDKYEDEVSYCDIVDEVE